MAYAIIATVRLRRSKRWDVKPYAERIDGLRHRFTRGWEIKDDDSSFYGGETAWIADREGWPEEAPMWVASGDLVDVVEERSPSVL